jgi:hypothetical protein
MIKKARRNFVSQIIFELYNKKLALMTNITLFSQSISKLDRRSYTKLVELKQTDIPQKGYNNWTLLVSMLFSQIAKSQSVRNISNRQRSATGNRTHLGI